MKDKLTNLIRKNGFLLFLFIGVCVVAAGTIMVATKDLKKPNDNIANKDLVILEDGNIEADQSSDETSEVISVEEPDIPDEIGKIGETEEVEEIIGETEEEIEYIEVSSPQFQQAILPLEGEILTEYTYDSLIYSDTLEEWRGHNGIDIKAAKGTNVLAPLDGVIKELYEDDLWGIVIVIEHGNGLETKFSNLETKEMVRVGLNVKQGDMISKVGNTAMIEMMMEPHIHFEATKDGKIVDPRSIRE